jgi:PIN domain nuclease of toxin-antitoxin system
MSEIIILDSHIWFWFINQEFDRFPSQWRNLIETAEQVGVSCVSCYEIALAYQRGRIELPCPPNQWFKESLEPVDIQLLPLTPNIAHQAVNLSPIHKDPFDRIIIATAIEYKAKLASIDTVFSKYVELEPYLLKK